MKPAPLALPGYSAVASGRLYSRETKAVGESGRPRATELLFTGRRRVVGPSHVYAAFAAAAQNVLEGSLEHAGPPSLESVLRHFPEGDLRSLAQGEGVARPLLERYLDSTETSRVPAGTACLYLNCTLMPTRIFKEMRARAAELGVERELACILPNLPGLVPGYGPRWSASLAIDDRGYLSEPMRVVSAFDQTVEPAREIGASLKPEMSERLGTLSRLLRTPRKLALVHDFSADAEQNYLLRLGHAAVRRALGPKGI